MAHGMVKFNVSLSDKRKQVEIFSVSRKKRILFFCNIVLVAIVPKSLFSNCCSLTNVEIHNSLCNGDPYNNAGQMTVLEISNFNHRV